MQVSVVLNRTVVVSDWRFSNLCGSYLQNYYKEHSNLNNPLILLEC